MQKKHCSRKVQFIEIENDAIILLPLEKQGLRDYKIDTVKKYSMLLILLITTIKKHTQRLYRKEIKVRSLTKAL